MSCCLVRDRVSQWKDLCHCGGERGSWSLQICGWGTSRRSSVPMAMQRVLGQFTGEQWRAWKGSVWSASSPSTPSCRQATYRPALCPPGASPWWHAARCLFWLAGRTQVPVSSSCVTTTSGSSIIPTVLKCSQKIKPFPWKHPFQISSQVQCCLLHGPCKKNPAPPAVLLVRRLSWDTFRSIMKGHMLPALSTDLN